MFDDVRHFRFLLTVRVMYVSEYCLMAAFSDCQLCVAERLHQTSLAGLFLMSWILLSVYPTQAYSIKAPNTMKKQTKR